MTRDERDDLEGVPRAVVVTPTPLKASPLELLLSSLIKTDRQIFLNIDYTKLIIKFRFDYKMFNLID